MNWKAYYQLARFHKPLGILLLWCPTAWALWIANKGDPDFNIMLLLLLGTILMRAAGCVMNDIADRQIDLHVQRTKNRPLTSGLVKLPNALIFLFALLSGALLILLQLPSTCFYYALIALAVTIAYPFCKRIIQGPQMVLGIAFSLGIPIAFAASNVLPNGSMGLLLLINFAWIIAYDTQYAMVDRADDLRIGVKSTAILFARYDRLIITLLQIFVHFSWLPLAIALKLSVWFYSGWIMASFILFYQYYLLASKKEENYFRAFCSNGWYGLIIWVSIIVGFIN
ncbi:MAG: 4-hydroxybenzoate octaprenyltransferase [Legionella sp.]|nr:4-hydroxybenzoate octaprenyltransferase [Legionella sp.]